MVERMYSIYDRVAEEASPPFLSKNDGVAMRQFKQATESRGVYNPGDYRLYYIGQWDTETLLLTALTAPVEVFSGGNDEFIPGSSSEGV